MSIIKSEIGQSLKYFTQAKEFAGEHNLLFALVNSLASLGNVYRIKGEYDRAIEFLESSLTLAEKVGVPNTSLFIGILVLLYLDNDSREQAQQYLLRLEKLSDQLKQKPTTRIYNTAKVIMLKASGRARNRAEAELLFKKIIEESEDVEYQFNAMLTYEEKFFSLVQLCELYLDDLNIPIIWK
ncbi:MAG: hypothetical protein ACFFG0_21575 [Candidatus Thorarchaeota archaeon]